VTKPKPRKVCVEAITSMAGNKGTPPATADGVQNDGAGRERVVKRFRNEDQTASLNDRAACSLIGSTASAIAFCAIALKSLVWLVMVSACLRANSV
jgi:hypothetical protein